ncbi:MAG: LytTR family DNA-binding domain-containing protein [Telluria sp.]|nr:LytTR family DNA-binding domain-containing protein [Telluria sp.]
MAENATPWLERYRPHRRQAEIGFWVVVLGLQVLFNSIGTWIDTGRTGRAVAFWQPLVWELSSNFAVGVLIPAVLAFERRFPLRWHTLPQSLGWHLAGSVAFSLAHVGLMLSLRYPAYALLGHEYRFGDWPTQLTYEYMKDIRSYALILVAVLSYRLLLLRLQGEARVLDQAEPAAGSPPAAAPARPERFLVRKLRKEFLIAALDIEWLQAQGNYVGLHVNGHDYLLRSTLADFMEQLDATRFARVHRSFAVNLDRVAEIEPLDGGDARLRMKDGSQVPCSRRYRDGLAG